MSELSAALVPEIVAACRAGLSEVVGAVGRALDVAVTAEVGEAAAFDLATTTDFAGAGLLMMAGVGDAAMLVALSESSGLLPPWVKSPDLNQSGKLKTLVHELGLIVLPDTLMGDAFEAAWTADAAAAMREAAPAADAQRIPIVLQAADGRTGTLSVVLPFAAGGNAFAVREAADAATAGATPSAAEEQRPKEKRAGVLRGAQAAEAAAQAAERRRPHPVSLDDLPNYSKNLLRIKVPVMVTLAQKKQSISKIVELGPGTIIQFSKACDQLLDLEVNGEHVGQGEAVKVGDKFGLRVATMTLPGERFKPVSRGTPPRAQRAD